MATLPEILRRIEVAMGENRLEEAERALLDGLRAHPLAAPLANALGVLRAKQDRLEEANLAYRQALLINPRGAGTWSNLGNILTRLGMDEAAIAAQRQALALEPRNNTTRYNLGITLGRADQHEEAAEWLARAMEKPNPHPQARWNLARHLLAARRWQEGWAHFDERLENGQVPDAKPPGARWRGEPFAGRTLLVLTEQGFGDTIWAARFLPRVRALGGRVLVQAKPPTRPLLEAMGLECVAPEAPHPPADLHIYICSLPGLFPGEFLPEPYIHADPARVASLRPRIAAAGRGFRIGIVWSGSVTFGANAQRAARLAPFVDAFLLPGVRLFSLQKGPPEAELAQHPLRGHVTDLAPHLNDFADTAAAISLLDLVLMTDSSVAHLAGAMGAPVWVLLGRSPHWMWEAKREDCDWYPSMRFFRQRIPPLEWSHVFDRAAAALMRRMAEAAPPALSAPGT
jgi:hypothetical protein